jgi:hypothetical protein
MAQPEQSIPWSEKRLTWSDYTGSPEQGTDAAAITSTSIAFEYHVKNNIPTYRISCNFSKERSWGKYRSDYILKHEQGHFDITEIYARKLARSLNEYRFNPRNFQEDLNKIYTTVMKEKEDFQEAYDEGTDYSRKKISQYEWLDKIHEDLNSLQDYRNYSVFTVSANTEVSKTVSYRASYKSKKARTRASL